MWKLHITKSFRITSLHLMWDALSWRFTVSIRSSREVLWSKTSMNKTIHFTVQYHTRTLSAEWGIDALFDPLGRRWCYLKPASTSDWTAFCACFTLSLHVPHIKAACIHHMEKRYPWLLISGFKHEYLFKIDLMHENTSLVEHNMYLFCYGCPWRNRLRHTDWKYFSGYFLIETSKLDHTHCQIWCSQMVYVIGSCDVYFGCIMHFRF